jgi:hypothetical protein
MRERCDFHRSTIAIENAFIVYTVFIPLLQYRRVIAALHAHRSRNCKLSFSKRYKIPEDSFYGLQSLKQRVMTSIESVKSYVIRANMTIG